VAELLALAKGEDVEATVIGYFGTEKRELVLNYRGQEVGRMSMEFVHKGVPMPRRKAVYFQKATKRRSDEATKGEIQRTLKETLAHPNVASKHWIIRQYDHEVQGGSVIKPLAGPLQRGPSDAAVIRPKLGSYRGVAIGCGLAPQIEDPYEMAVAAIDEAVRNVVAVGADPGRTAILDNFCWPGTNDEQSMGALVRTCEACYDAAKAFGIPFISGKDSLHNQFTDRQTGKVIRIPNTLLISAIGVIEDVRKCVSMDLKGGRGDTALCLVSAAGSGLKELITAHRAVAEATGKGLVLSCHDVSDGGWLTAAAEMCVASGLGLSLERDGGGAEAYFGEGPGRYLIEIDRQGTGVVAAFFKSRGVELRELGGVTASGVLEVGYLDPATRSRKYDCHVFVDELTKAWRGTLDW
jgi:phosphoribosylformylglycinamidine synthase